MGEIYHFFLFVDLFLYQPPRGNILTNFYDLHVKRSVSKQETIFRTKILPNCIHELKSTKHSFLTLMPKTTIEYRLAVDKEIKESLKRLHVQNLDHGI
jgi:hypothetical protein